MAIELISKIKPANGGSFALIDAADVEMPDGGRLSEFAGGGGSAEIPIFDLAALGMTAIPLTGGNAALETDTTELFEALNNGAVTFGLPVTMDGVTITGYCTMHSFTDGATMHQCVGPFISDYPVYLMVVVQENLVIAAAFPFSAFSGLPEVSEANEGNFLRVVNGAWAAAAIDNAEEASF